LAAKKEQVIATHARVMQRMTEEIRMSDERTEVLKATLREEAAAANARAEVSKRALEQARGQRGDFKRQLEAKARELQDANRKLDAKMRELQTSAEEKEETKKNDAYHELIRNALGEECARRGINRIPMGRDTIHLTRVVDGDSFVIGLATYPRSSSDRFGTQMVDPAAYFKEISDEFQRAQAERMTEIKKMASKLAHSQLMVQAMGHQLVERGITSFKTSNGKTVELTTNDSAKIKGAVVVELVSADTAVVEFEVLHDSYEELLEEVEGHKDKATNARVEALRLRNLLEGGPAARGPPAARRT
jgi:hypothetical protein